PATVSYALAHVQAPQPVVPSAAAGRQPQLVLAGTGLIRLSAGQQQPLPGELLKAAPSDVLKLRWIELVLNCLFGVMSQHQRGAALVAELGHRAEHFTLNEQIARV